MSRLRRYRWKLQIRSLSSGLPRSRLKRRRCSAVTRPVCRSFAPGQYGIKRPVWQLFSERQPDTSQPVPCERRRYHRPLFASEGLRSIRNALAEENIVTSTLNPDFPAIAERLSNQVLKSGTNTFHGSGFEFYRDTFLTNGNYFLPHPASISPKSIRRNPGRTGHQEPSVLLFLPIRD